jgi:hypothetical protein
MEFEDEEYLGTGDMPPNLEAAVISFLAVICLISFCCVVYCCMMLLQWICA